MNGPKADRVAGGDSGPRHGSLAETQPQPAAKVLVPCFLGEEESGDVIFPQVYLLPGLSDKDTMNIDLNLANFHNEIFWFLYKIQAS